VSLVLVSEAAPLLKRCNMCGLFLPHSGYYADRRNKDGRQSECKTCSKKRKRKWQREQAKCDPEFYRKKHNKHPPLPAAVLFNAASARARKKGLPFEITREWVNAGIEAGVCQLTNEPFYFGPDNFHSLQPSLDRIDSSLGYVPGNVRMICLILNLAKSSMSDDEFRELFLRLADAMRRHAA
jgi:hypothetical protein